MDEKVNGWKENKELKSQSGTKFDRAKPRTDLLSPWALRDVAQVLEYGAKEYGDRNWEKGFNWSRAYGAALRHLLAFWMGESIDPESGLPHLAHANCEIMFLQQFEYTHPELDDRPQMEEFPVERPIEYFIDNRAITVEEINEALKIYSQQPPPGEGDNGQKAPNST